MLLIADIIKATMGKLISGHPEITVNGISTDTRTIKPGELFIPLQGENFNGHHFLEEAIEKGASGFITSKDTFPTPKQAIIIKVDNTLNALMDIASAYRKRFPIPLVAVTGSTGKTTTKEMIAHLLSQRFKTLKAKKSYNNEIGVPLTIMELNSTYHRGVFELAMRGKGQIAQLAKILRPEIGVITNIGEAHLELLKDQKEIAQAKGELLEWIPPQGAAILNRSNPWYEELSQKACCKILDFGNDNRACYYPSLIKLSLKGTSFILNTPQGSTEIILPLIGYSQAINFTAAAACALYWGITLTEIKQAALTLSPLPQRMNLKNVTRLGLFIIDDTYNANPTSCEEAIKTLAIIGKETRKIAILGDMLELGEKKEKFHRDLGEKIVAYKIDLLFTLGHLSAFIADEALKKGMKPEKVKSYYSYEELEEGLRQQLQPGDIILIKSSRKMKLEKIVSFIEENF